ncbi:superoxide dismutase [Ni] [Ferrimonas lipolytica]|uniref:Superoxide dismutase n=1 Tax=Ferrimonas lipolytica TaxID=2724191 RepID=A0A6H1ULC8_9GAMM|nr:superoxide dismutase [Ni] [Ferrimonas lipolytica]QIZ78602.1 superoxide dismutase [Ferrimonas lipolytica]
MKKQLQAAVFAAVTFFAMVPSAFSHCQIPCGIYDDHAKVQEMLQDVATTRKAVAQVGQLAGKKDAQSSNQLVRWVMNKEQHAQNVIATISDYFLTQRVKADQKDYAERLQKHHAVIVAAMKVKQNADSKYVDDLENKVKALLPYYPEHKH